MRKIKGVLYLKNLNKSLLVLTTLLGISFSYGADKGKGSFSLGFVQTSGNSETTTVKGTLSYTNKGNIYRVYINSSVLYGSSNGEKNAEEIKFNGRFERRFLPLFVFWDVNYYRNPFKGYRQSLGTGPGAGIYIINNDRLYLTLGYYVYRVVNKLTDKYSSENFDKSTERYFQHHIEERFKWKILKNLSLKEKLIYKITSRSNEDYFIDFYTAIENKITNRLSLEISYTVNYQNRPVGKKIKKTDTIFMTGIKYSF